jgi:5-methylcytosine-specific restriction protein A
MGNDKAELQYVLETKFDIPFHVESGITNGDPWYRVRPAGYANESFEIRLSFLNQLRLNMEFLPDTYAAPLIKDMSNSSPDQRAAFFRYAGLLLDRKAKPEFLVNNTEISVIDDSDWPPQWNNIKFKITKSPITEEGEYFSPEAIVADWGSLFVGMVLSLLEVVPIPGETEGDLYRTITNRHERSTVNRNICLAVKGYSCRVCGMDFESKYGEIGNGFIHVHHTTMVSEMGPRYIVDPVNDLEPVCPNCHAMLHKKNPPMDIEELKKTII